jgi:hypothetical protein
VFEIGESAFEAADDSGIRMPPFAIGSERRESRQRVARGKLFEDEVHQRRGGLADGKARMRAAFEQDHRMSEASRNHRQQRSAEAGTNDGKVEIHSHQLLVSVARP